MTVQCDVSNRDEVERMILAVTERFGVIDLLVANAGIIQVGPVQTMRVEAFEEALGTMYWGVVYPALAVLPGMRGRRYGRIAVVTSIGSSAMLAWLTSRASSYRRE